MLRFVRTSALAEAVVANESKGRLMAGKDDMEVIAESYLDHDVGACVMVFLAKCSHHDPRETVPYLASKGWVYQMSRRE